MRRIFVVVAAVLLTGPGCEKDIREVRRPVGETATPLMNAHDQASAAARSIAARVGLRYSEPNRCRWFSIS